MSEEVSPRVAQTNESSLVPEQRPDLKSAKISRSVELRGTPEWLYPTDEDLEYYTDDEIELLKEYRSLLDNAIIEEREVLNRAMEDAFETSRRIRDPLGRLVFALGYGHIETDDVKRKEFLESLVFNVSNYYRDENGMFPSADKFFPTVQVDFLNQSLNIIEELRQEDSDPKIWEGLLFDMLMKHWVYYSHYEFLNKRSGVPIHPFDHILTLESNDMNERNNFLREMAKKSNRLNMSAFENWGSFFDTFREILNSQKEFASIVSYIRSKDSQYVRLTGGFGEISNSTPIRIANNRGSKAIYINRDLYEPGLTDIKDVCLVLEKKKDRNGRIYLSIVTSYPVTFKKGS